ncbi:MFS transporter, partial [Alphaproteobacteria bacterium]|nr:MFS transporter [Alphaproteobacteria bacterium]MDC0344801.1 MFS transporter [Alphaproteobacteria bacterium]
MVWAMWALASLFYAYQYILRVLPNIMMDQIQDRFQIDAALFGQYSGLYYIGYAGVHIPIGILLDRLGPRAVMSSCILLTVVGMMSLIYTDVWIYPLVGRFLIGIGSSAAILGVFKVIRLAFPEDRFVRMLGFSVAIGLVGAIYGGQPVSFLMSFMGWEKVIEIICVAGILLAVAVYAIIPPYDPPKRKNNSARNDMTTVLSNGKVLFICLLGGLMIGPLEGFADAWGTGYLKAAYTQLSTATAAYLPSFIFLGMCFGSPILSLVAEKTQAYYRLIIVSACVMGVVFMY